MTKQYDYLVVGGGPGGTPTAMALAAAGRRVLLVEKGPGLGGTCLFEGCIPSKIFRESARRFAELKESAKFGLCLPTQDVTINWSAILERKRSILKRRSDAALNNTEHFKTLETLTGQCSLVDAHTACITFDDASSDEVKFDKAILSTGSTPFIPPIRGADQHRVYDSESILNIDHIPSRLVIIGGGPIGVELGQIFKTFGSDIHILEAAPRILMPVDEELALHLQQRMINEGINITTRCQVTAINHSGQSVFVEYTAENGEKQRVNTDAVLMVTGRRPNVDGLGLENTRVKHTSHGIEVNDNLQTAEDNIYAVGDVIGQPMFAHWATAQGLALARSLLGQKHMFPRRESNTAVIFSQPEIGIAGLTEQQARDAGMDVSVARYDYSQDARAQINARDEGLLKIIYDNHTHHVVGVHAMVDGAESIMGEAALLVQTQIPVEAIAGSIHPHPTLTESFVFAIRNAMMQAAQKNKQET